MAKDVDKNIKEKFSLYTSLLNERKSLSYQTIDVLELKKNNNHFLTKDTITSHITLPDEIVFTIDIKTSNYKYFQFKLKCEHYQRITSLDLTAMAEPTEIMMIHCH